MIGFAARDAWAVADDGAVVVVRAGTYRVESYAPDGRMTTGPSYAYSTRPVTAEDRSRFVSEFLESSAMSGRGPGGGMGHAPTASPAEIQRLVETTEFAERHPYFLPDQVLTAPGGGVWVDVGATKSGSARYDVFDRSGQRIGRVQAASWSRTTKHV